MTGIKHRLRNNLSFSASIRYRALSISLILSIFILSGCVTLVDTEGSQEQRSDAIVTIQDGEEFRQTFVSRRPGLNHVELWLRPPVDGSQPTGYIKAELRSDLDGPDPIAEVVFTPAHLESGGDTVSLSFPAQNNSANTIYEISLRSSGGAAQVLGRYEDVYGPGSAAHNGSFLLADAAFRTSYIYNLNSILDDIRELLSNILPLLSAALVLLLPGWLLVDWSGADHSLDSGEKIALALGLSLAAIPLVMLWTSQIGLRWSRWMVVSVYSLLAAILVYRIWRKYRDEGGLSALSVKTRTTISSLKSGPSIFMALIGIFFITLFVRFVMVRDISAPPWVDSVHHALITRLIMEQGILPALFDPYIQIDASSYHPGIHTALASQIWLSNTELMQAMLLFGQALNALSIFAVYLFTTTLLADVQGRRLAGLLAALVAGLFTPMPAYYTSWGRYTQLAALIILPAALALMLRSLKTGKARTHLLDTMLGHGRWKLILTAAIALAGLFLTHYRATAFFVCLLLAYALVYGVRWALRRRHSNRNSNREIAPIAAYLFLLCGAALILALPWLLPALQDLLLPRLIAWIPTTSQPFDGVTWPYLNTAWGNYAMILAVSGLVWGILQRQAFPFVLALWTGLMFFIANLGMFGLPGSGFVNGISVTITLYLPIAVLAGYILSQVIITIETVIPARGHGIYHWGLAALGVAFAVLAARPLIPLLNPVTFLFRPADRPAIAWVKENIPPGETVLVNPFGWGYGQYAGNDAGYWISAVGDLPTFPPPVLYGLSNTAEYINNINTTSQRIIDHADDPVALHTLLDEQGISFVFIGGRGGVLSPQALHSSPLFAPRYTKDGAFIYEVLP